jgi:uroporphyrinogen-III synthase
LAQRAKELGSEWYPARIAAIGPATAKAVVEAGLSRSTQEILMPPEYVAESLAATLLKICDGQQDFLLVRAEEAREVIPTVLEAAGHRVSSVAAYRNSKPAEALPLLRSLFASAESYPDIITFTSSSTARSLFALLDTLEIRIPPGTALASIGPITSATLRELGHEPTYEAKEATIDALAEAIVEHLHRVT